MRTRITLERVSKHRVVFLDSNVLLVLKVDPAPIKVAVIEQLHMDISNASGLQKHTLYKL